MDILLSVVVILQLGVIPVFIVFRIVCFFKKTCKWKSCPFRHTDIFYSDTACRKCPYPYDQKEKDAIVKEIEDMVIRLKQSKPQLKD